MNYPPLVNNNNFNSQQNARHSSLPKNNQINGNGPLGSTQNSSKLDNIDKNALKNMSASSNNPSAFASGSNHIYGAGRG